MPFSEGLAAVMSNGKWGYADGKGRMVIPAKFDEAGGFSELFAAVMLNGKFGYIDKDGMMVIPPKYLSAKPFYGGLALVYYETMHYYIT